MNKDARDCANIQQVKPQPMDDLATLRTLLEKYDLYFQWTGPHSKVEEPWRLASGFTCYPLLNYQLVKKGDPAPTT